MNDDSHFTAGHKAQTDIGERNMGEVIRFVSRAELERMRLSRGSRTRDNSMLPPAVSVSAPREQKSELVDS